jgi:hypothetical protein
MADRYQPMLINATDRLERGIEILDLALAAYSGAATPKGPGHGSETKCGTYCPYLPAGRQCPRD